MKGPRDQLIQGGPPGGRDKAAERLRQFEQARRRSPEPRPAEEPSPQDEGGEVPSEKCP